MLREIVRFFINGMGLCLNVTKNLILDKVGTLNITYYNFLIFFVYIVVVIRVISFIKGIQEVEEDNKKKYNEEKRYKK